jgi:hypothetical protein
MPKRITVLLDRVLSKREEKLRTKKTVPRPKTNPAAGRVNPPKKGRENPVRMMTAAPRDAPEETPRI